MVLGQPDGAGAIAAICRGQAGFVRFLAVAPRRRRHGLGRRLLDDATDWLKEQGAADVHVGADAPFYLWPGVDTAAAEALSFFEAAGYARAGVELNMSFASAFQAAAPAGVRINRVPGEDAGAVLAFVGRHWPNWVAEAERAVQLDTCFVAVEESSAEVVGFIGHSVNRVGWLGPMGTDPARQRGGVGSALVAAVAADARDAGRERVEIAWVGPVGFYVKAVGAVVSRTFVRMRSRISR